MNDTSIVYDYSWDDYCLSDLCYSNVVTILLITHYGIGITYVVVGVTGRVFLLMVLIKGNRQGTYQTLLVISEICADVSKILYLLSSYWLWIHDWYRQTFWLMWFSTYMSVMILSTFSQHTVLMALATAADRLFALKKPVAYKVFNHGRMRGILMITGLCISCLISVFECFRYQLVEVEDGYTYEVNDAFVDSPLGKGMQYLRITTVMVCLLLMIAANVSMVWSYRKFRKTTSMAKGDEAKKKQTEKLLLLMAIAQCSSMSMAATSNVVFSIFQYSSMGTCACWIEGAGDISDGVTFLVDIVNVVACLLLNKSVRRLCRKFLRFITVSLIAAPTTSNVDSVKITVRLFNDDGRGDRF